MLTLTLTLPITVLSDHTMTFVLDMVCQVFRNVTYQRKYRGFLKRSMSRAAPTFLHVVAFFKYKKRRHRRSAICVLFYREVAAAIFKSFHLPLHLNLFKNTVPESYFRHLVLAEWGTLNPSN